MSKRKIIVTVTIIVGILVGTVATLNYYLSTSHVKNVKSKKESPSKKELPPKGIQIDGGAESSSSHLNTIVLTEYQKSEINHDFLDWAIDRARMGNMAVTDLYFNHGSGGHGDYFASTPDGDIQVQDMNNPGASGFSIHAIGGVTFYTTLSGDTGYQDLSSNSIADGYGNDYDTNEPAVKYLLADNGVVYESIHHTGVNGPGSGYYEMDDTGKLDGTKEYSFYESKDSAAQSELKSILKKYTTN